MPVLVSYGGGTNSTAMLIGMVERRERPEASFSANGRLILRPENDLEAWALLAWDNRAIRDGEGHSFDIYYTRVEEPGQVVAHRESPSERDA